MNHPIKISLILWLVCLTNLGYGQSSIEEDRGDVFLESFEFDKAIELYEIAYTNDSTNTALTRKIADAHRRQGNLSASAPWYEKTLALDTTRQEDMLYYAEALKTLEQYDESLVWYEKYNALQPKDDRAQDYADNSQYYEELAEDSLMFVVNKLDFNNKKPAFGVTKFEEKLVFSATGFENQKFNKTNPWNNLPYLDVYEANIDENNQAVDIQPINEINSKYNDGPAHYDESSQTIFITRNNMRRGKPVKDKTGSVNLKIYTSKLVDGEWSDIEELPFNSNDYSTGHPAVTADGQYLYFASNKPGGEGGTDIYVSEKINDTWGHPTNLGDNVNTKGNELFPYIDDNGILYFSSTGHVGLGGLDIFKINLDSIETSVPKNMGYPINGPKDDFSILFEQVDQSGYFCSNRDKGFSDDIFYFEVNHALQKRYAGRIESSLPEKSLAGNILVVRDLDTGVELEIELGEHGEFEFEATPGATYELAYQKGDVEEILLVKTVEETVNESYENLGIFTIYERMAVNVYDDGEELEINDVLYKRFAADGQFISEKGDTLNEVEMMDLLTSNLEGNDIELNNELYKHDSETSSYTQEDGETIEDIELEQLLVSQIFVNPLDLTDESQLADLSTMDIEVKNADLSALEWIEKQLMDETLTKSQKLELEALKLTELSKTTALDWLDVYADAPEKAADLSEVERMALGFLTADIAAEMSQISALEWVEKKLADENLTEREAMELEALQNSNLDQISASDWLAIYTDEEKAKTLSDIERKALEMYDSAMIKVDTEMVTDIVPEAVKEPVDAIATPENAETIASTPISNPEDYVLESKEELKVALTNKGLENIYFDFDRSSIRKDAKPVLDEIIALLTVNEGVNLYVNAHTDARGSNSYNQYLSEKRAESVSAYLKQRGIDPSRLQLSWFGEDQLTNACADGAKCEEHAHELNRRATFALAGEITASTENTYVAAEETASTAAAASSKVQPGASDAELAGSEGLQQIYYDFDKSNIRKDAQMILDELAASMNSNNKAVSINAHTDARGSSDYNAVLSEKRAKSAKDYLINKGISADRISINWAGETQLSNGCSDGITCDGNEHQRNRRATIAWK